MARTQMMRQTTIERLTALARASWSMQTCGGRRAGQLAAGEATLLGLWGDGRGVHMALRRAGDICVLSLPAPTGAFRPSLHPPAGAAAGARHPRPVRAGARRLPDDAAAGSTTAAGGCAIRWASATTAPPPVTPMRSSPPKARRCIRSPSGPVHAGIIEPGHFRFTANGETVVRLEERLGYVHKGIDSS